MLLPFLVLIFVLANEGYCYSVHRHADNEILATRLRNALPISGKLRCPKPCGENLYDPVCGSDGKTYDNMCIFEDASICQNLRLTIVHNGRCKVECPKPCSENLYDPVCGSDGKTYDNRCVFEDASICRNLRLTIVRNGRCKETGKKCFATMLKHKHLLGEYRPECNTDGTYKEKQCHEGYCFCVEPQTGKEIMGTRIRGMPKICHSPCITERHQKLTIISTFGWLGIPSPRCTSDGKYDKVQCVRSHCFCVEPMTGKPIAGKRLMLKNSNEPNCE